MIERYKIPSYEALVAQMLAKIPESLDKREGSMIFNAVAPAAAELAQLYIQLAWTLDQSFPDTADRHHLIRRAIERGLAPYPASAAILRAKVSPKETQLPVGARFNLGELNYKVIANEEEAGSYRIQCESLGTKGNLTEGELIPIEYMEGLASAKVTALLVAGEDEEETEAFRKRYIASFAGMAYGGNIADYKSKVAKITGVGGVKVLPVWDGGGTVKILLLGGDNTVPTAEFVQEVQEALDPIEHGGKGDGIAPVGHRVTVEGVEPVTVNMQMQLAFDPGYQFLDLKAEIEKALKAFLKREIDQWEEQALTVRLSQIQYTLLQVPKVKDVQHVTLNGVQDNLRLAGHQVPVLGTVTNDGTPLKKL